jgi:hypothetical protein
MSPSVDDRVRRRQPARRSIEESAMSASDETVAEHYLSALRARGIERLFFNAGTDFAPLVEAYARGDQSNAPPFPEPILARTRISRSAWRTARTSSPDDRRR